MTHFKLKWYNFTTHILYLSNTYVYLHFEETNHLFQELLAGSYQLNPDNPLYDQELRGFENWGL